MTTLVGIDIGSQKICTMIGEALPDGGFRILGMGHAPAEGIRAGEVVHVEDAAGSIAASVERAERIAGLSISAATVGITGTHIGCEDNEATIPLGRRSRMVEQMDVDRVLETAGAIHLAPGREILHVLPQRFRLDEGAEVDSPLGMEGQSLSVDVHVITASSAALSNMRRCLEMIDIRESELVFSTLAAAESTLTRDERELGVFLVDMGASSTGIACYSGGSLCYSSVLELGSKHLTNDLAVLLQTPLEQAERIKKTYGHVLPELDDEGVEINITPFGETEQRKTTRLHVSEVLAARSDELAGLIAEELQQAGFAEAMAAGAVLTGGGTDLKGLPRRLHEGWGLPVRVGKSRSMVGLNDSAKGPAQAATFGLLHWKGKPVVDAANLGRLAQETNAVPQGGMGKALTWAKAAFLPNAQHRAHIG